MSEAGQGRSEAKHTDRATLRSWFDAIDRDRNQELDAIELQRALARGQLHFSLQTVAHMIRLHDRQKTGTITFEEFENLHNFLTNMQYSFQHFDKDRNGKLTIDEIHSALQYAGLPEFIALSLFLQSASAVFRAFDSQKSGSVSLDFNQFIYATVNCL